MIRSTPASRCRWPWTGRTGQMLLAAVLPSHVARLRPLGQWALTTCKNASPPRAPARSHLDLGVCLPLLFQLLSGWLLVGVSH